MKYITEVSLAYKCDLPDPRARQFTLGTHWINWLYPQCLQPFQPGNAWKLVVELYDGRLKSPPEQAWLREPYAVERNGLGVVFAVQPVDLNPYFALGKTERKLWQLDQFQIAALRIAEKPGWPVEVFERAYACCIKNGLETRRIFREPKMNAARKLRATIWWLIDSDGKEIYLVVADRDGAEIQKWVLERRRADQIDVYFPYDELGTFHWTGPTTVRLTSRDRATWWEATVGDPVVRTAGPKISAERGY